MNKQENFTMYINIYIGSSFCCLTETYIQTIQTFKKKKNPIKGMCI